MTGQDTTAKNDTLRGIVVNSVTHEAIGRALVYSPDERFATMSDSNVHFEFALPAETEVQRESGQIGVNSSNNPGFRRRVINRLYALTARKPGFLNQSQQNVNAETGPKEITISLVPEALIVGHVAVPNAEAPDRVQVEIYRREVQEGRAHWASVGVINARSSGDFRFSELRAGTYKLLTHELLDRDPKDGAPGGQIYGYPPVYYPDAGDFASAGTIELTAGKTTRVDFSLVKQPYYPIRVPLVNVPPGVSLNVFVSVQGRKGPGYALGYNPEEQRIEGLLPAGTYRIEVQGYGPVVVAGITTVTVPGLVERPGMTVSLNLPIEVKLIKEFSSQQSNDYVVRSGGPPGPRQYLNLNLEPADDFEQMGGASLRPPTNPRDDSLVLENVHPGRYWVRSFAMMGYVLAMTSGGIDLLRQPLVVPFGGSVPPIEVTLRDDNAFIQVGIESSSVSAQENSGTVLAPGAQSSDGSVFAYVYCVSTSDSAGYFAQMNVASNGGQLASIAVPPGAYQLLAFSESDPGLEFRNPEAMRAYNGKGQVVRVGPGEKQRVQLHVIGPNEQESAK